VSTFRVHGLRPAVAAMALLVALTAYCQLHSIVYSGRVPLETSLRWAMVTAATWTVAACFAWQWRERLLAMLASGCIARMARASAVLFVLALAAANAALILEVANPGFTASDLPKRLLRYGPVAAATAAFAACWLLLQRRRRAPEGVGQWLQLPQEPRLMLRSSDLRLVRSAGNYCELHANGRTHLVRTTLKDLESQLEARGFLRVHRTAMVNLGSVAAIAPAPGTKRLQIELEGGGRVPVGRAYVARVRSLAESLAQ
jgi:DNA-binding LytR/AlgR family response regulator